MQSNEIQPLYMNIKKLLTSNFAHQEFCFILSYQNALTHPQSHFLFQQGTAEL